MSRSLRRIGGALGLWWLSVAALEAQLPDLPTLSGAGIEYISPSGFFQLSFSGQLDLEGIHTGDSWAGLIDHEANEGPIPPQNQSCLRCHIGIAFPADGGEHAAHRLRVFAGVFLGDHLYSSIEVRSDRGEAPSDAPTEARIEQAFVRLSSTSGAFGLQLGRFVSPFGEYGNRHLTVDDPFLRPPLAYDYRTVMSRTLVPEDAEKMTEFRDGPLFMRKTGAPPVWGVPYQWGAMALGRIGPVDVKVAAMNSAPSSDPEAWGWDADRFERPSWVVSARAQASPSLAIGASYDRGPWMEEIVAGTILPGTPAGLQSTDWRDFDQELIALDLRLARGATVLTAEAMIERWAVPNVGERPTEVIYSAEAQRDLAAGFSVAVRAGFIDFRPLADGLGAASPLPGGEVDWDHDITRLEGSVGYRLARNVGVLASAFRQTQKEASDGDTHLVGLRLWWAF